MSFMMKYVDKRSATIAAIKDYENMVFIIRCKDRNVSEEYEKATRVGCPVNDGLPHMKDAQARENRIVESLDQIDFLKNRYMQAKEYMNWFEPAWNELTEEERFVLQVFYLKGNSYGSNAANTIAETYNIEQSSAYRKKNRALDHLTILLFGQT